MGNEDCWLHPTKSAFQAVLEVLGESTLTGNGDTIIPPP